MDQGYLGKFGYLADASREVGPVGLTSKDAYVDAIKRLQRFGNITETGVVDRRTIELMNKPRCGVPDESTIPTSYSLTSGFYRTRHRRYVLSPTKWEKNDLTYRILNTTPDLSAEKVRQILRDAFRVWSIVTPLTFTEVVHSIADILILFAEGNHDDGYAFDGKGSVLAHAFFPGEDKGGDTHFDEAETWTFNSSEGVDLFMVAAHEFGHALGLAHSSNTEALMYPWYQGYTDNFKLPFDDVQGIQTLYGSKSGTLPPTPIPRPTRPDGGNNGGGGGSGGGGGGGRPDVPPVTPRPPVENDSPCAGNIDAITVIRKEIFIFKGSKFWRRGPSGIGLTPTEISKFWFKLPEDGVDALYERADGKIVFFKVDRFWMYNSNHMVSNFPVEGRRLTELGIGSNVKKIDAAFIWSYNKRTYLVSGDMYWKLNANQDYIEYDYPRDMSIWRNVPVPLDSAFQNWDGNTYFLKGDQYWEFYDTKMRTRHKEGRSIGELLGCRNGEMKGDLAIVPAEEGPMDDEPTNAIQDNHHLSSSSAFVNSYLTLVNIAVLLLSVLL
ncbi:matrix metalloproteinase-2-like [Dreissena polymorpha]|uniref:matrix metalloproteinase-2-like n=1 Tax=Dreissena polymorpha TaxID=45954 RepID=UPI002263BB17|nr:matrix metalloproteinase-2-like [Dreissena polymorpha]